MIGRGAHERQAERDVDALIEGERLQRDERLVVIHADGGIVGSPRAAWNSVSAGVRAGRVESLARAAAIAGTMMSISSRPGAVLAGMRIEPGNGQARLRQTEIAAQGRGP